MWKAGDRVKNYRIIAPFKTGGMATLYIAQRKGVSGFTRKVILKTIHPHHAKNENFIQMFLDEALLASRVYHPNVVHIDELIEARGTYIIAMEYVDGYSLSEMCRMAAKAKRSFSLEMAVAIAIQASNGLHAAHEIRDESNQSLNFVHRDVSPSNIILGFEGQIKIIDFGIAKAKSRLERTSPNTIKGKPQYMAPEQALGQPIDRRADVFSLGIILWELLTMQPLFNVQSTEEFLATFHQDSVIKPSAIAAHIPSRLDATVMSALSLDPQKRPSTMKSFREQLVSSVPKAANIDVSVFSNWVRRFSSMSQLIPCAT